MGILREVRILPEGDGARGEVPKGEEVAVNVTQGGGIVPEGEGEGRGMGGRRGRNERRAGGSYITRWRGCEWRGA